MPEPTPTFKVYRDADDVWKVIGFGRSPNPSGATTLDDLTDVDATAPSDGDVLIWDAASGAWMPGTTGSSGTVDLNDLTDVDASSPSDGDSLTWNAAAGMWVPGTVTGGDGTSPLTLDDLTDVDAASPSAGDALLWDAGANRWIPGATGSVPTGIDNVAQVLWTKQLNSSSMATMADWTAAAGTWTPGGPFGVSQTATLQDAWLYFNPQLAGFRGIQATIRRTAATTSGYIGFGFGGTSWANGAVSIRWNVSSGSFQFDRFGTGTEDVGTLPFTADTDFLMQVFWDPFVGKYRVYVNDALVAIQATSAQGATARVGLSTRNLTSGGTAWFRNVSVWSGVTTIVRPS